ncbi:unnamed protein product [Sphagnum balticum]
MLRPIADLLHLNAGQLAALVGAEPASDTACVHRVLDELAARMRRVLDRGEQTVNRALDPIIKQQPTGEQAKSRWQSHFNEIVDLRDKCLQGISVIEEHMDDKIDSRAHAVLQCRLYVVIEPALDFVLAACGTFVDDWDDQARADRIHEISTRRVGQLAEFSVVPMDPLSQACHSCFKCRNCGHTRFAKLGHVWRLGEHTRAHSTYNRSNSWQLSLIDDCLLVSRRRPVLLDHCRIHLCVTNKLEAVSEPPCRHYGGDDDVAAMRTSGLDGTSTVQHGDARVRGVWARMIDPIPSDTRPPVGTAALLILTTLYIDAHPSRLHEHTVDHYTLDTHEYEKLMRQWASNLQMRTAANGRELLFADDDTSDAGDDATMNCDAITALPLQFLSAGYTKSVYAVRTIDGEQRNMRVVKFANDNGRDVAQCRMGDDYAACRKHVIAKVYKELLLLRTLRHPSIPKVGCTVI